MYLDLSTAEWVRTPGPDLDMRTGAAAVDGGGRVSPMAVNVCIVDEKGRIDSYCGFPYAQR